MFGYNAAGVGPGGVTPSSAGAYLDRALTLATAKAGAPGGQVRNALSQAAQSRAAAKAAAVAAMPHIGMGGLGASRAGAGWPAAVNAAAASFGGSGPPPSYGGNSFVLGPLGDSGAGQRTTDPRARYDRAIQQGANALFGMLRTPGGDAPDGPFGVALANSARAVAAARADIEAEGSLFGTGYGTLTPGNPATRAAAARLAAELGVGPAGSGGSAEPRTPWWRFGMAENPYLLAARSRPPTSGTMAAYMQALDAASRAAARSRGRNTLIGGPGGDVPASTDSSSIWAHTGRAKGPFEAPLARARNPDEIGGKRLEVLYGDPLFKEYLHRLAIREGAESDDATDRGGATKLGMSQKFLTALRDRDPNDVPG